MLRDELNASSAKRGRQSADSNSDANASGFELFDAPCNSNSPIGIFLDSSVYYNAPTRTSRMDALLITATPLIANDNKSATHGETKSLTTKHASRRRPEPSGILALLPSSGPYVKFDKS